MAKKKQKQLARIARVPMITVSFYIPENLAQTIAAKALNDRRSMSECVTIQLEKLLGVTP